MKVFKVKSDFRYQSFHSFGEEDPRHKELVKTSLSRGRGTSWAEIWVAPDLHAEGPPLPIGNFAHLWDLGDFAIDDRACEVLKPILESVCEFHPYLPYEGKSFHWMNVMETVDCLDEEKTKWRIGKSSGKRFAIEKYQFSPGRFTKSTLFRLPKDSALLALAETPDPKSEFKSIVERQELTGLKFEEIWSEGGPPIKARGLREILRSEADDREPTGTYLDLVQPLYKVVMFHRSPQEFAASTQSVPRRTLLLFAAKCCVDEVGNGGLLQLFINTTGILVPEAIEAFGKLGMPLTAELLRHAALQLGTPYPRDVKERHTALLRGSRKTPEEITQISAKAQNPIFAISEAARKPEYDAMTSEFWKSSRKENGGFDLAATRYWKSLIVNS
jgi:hypothetical protein